MSNVLGVCCVRATGSVSSITPASHGAGNGIINVVSDCMTLLHLIKVRLTPCPSLISCSQPVMCGVEMWCVVFGMGV